MIFLSGERLSYPSALSSEWLLANGRGGFVSSTVLGINTRRYHGFFIAPSEDRKLLLAKLEEEVIRESDIFPLSSNIYGEVVYPQGYQHLQSFRFNGWSAEWIYQLEGIVMKKKVVLPRGRDVLAVLYEVLRAEAPFKLRIFPLLNFRSYHSLSKQNDLWAAKVEGNVVEITSPYRFYLLCDRGTFRETGNWYYDMTYPQEKERGLDYKEDHFNIGFFEMELRGGEQVGFLCSPQLPSETPEELYREERERAERLLRKGEIRGEGGIDSLLLAADSFLVEWQGRKSIIAGYHWFTDWGRDAMIALPGLCLPTGRREEGKEIILSFLRYLRGGLIPNAFMEGEMIYNSVDGVLWLFWAVYQLLKAKWDEDFAIEVFPYLLQVVSDLQGGKAGNVQVTDDGLIWAGDEEVCMTWMDARVGGKPVVARQGKAVEVNALWLFALGFLEELSFRLERDFPYGALLRSARKSFLAEFYAERGLYDVVRGERKDGSLRPNQVIAAALPYVPLSQVKRREIEELALAELYTPFGLRSLGKGEAGYKGHYTGGVEERDSAYHQGTAWAYLLGFLGELLRGKGEKKLGWLSEPFRGHLLEAGLGTISEIFDGDYPWNPRGCISQAWSVGELLRIIWEMRDWESNSLIP